MQANFYKLDEKAIGKWELQRNQANGEKNDKNSEKTE